MWSPAWAHAIYLGLLVRGFAVNQPRKHGYEFRRNFVQQVPMIATKACIHYAPDSTR